MEPVPVVVHDPKGPIGWRALPYLLAVAALATIAVATSLSAWSVIALAILAGCAAAGAAPLFPGRLRARAGTLTLGAGRVRLRAGMASQTLRARDVLGASTAELDGGRVVLSLARADRSGVPIALELGSERDAGRVREALGVGGSGFGAVIWPLGPRAERRLRIYALLTIAATLASVLGLVLAALGDGPSGVGNLLFLFGTLAACGLSLFSVLHRATERGVPEPYLALRSDGLHVCTRDGWRCIPFADVESAHEAGDLLVVTETSGRATVLQVPPSSFSRGLSLEDRRAILAQIRSAAGRARGLGELPSEISAHVAELAHRPGESLAAWRARVEQAARLFSHGYRGAAFGLEDLWRVAEDPDAAADLRGAAGRILVRVDVASRARVAALTDATRDPRDRALMRAAVDDEPPADEAEAALERVGTLRAGLPR